jgi:hypothetical protein
MFLRRRVNMRYATALLFVCSMLGLSARAAVCEAKKHPGITAIYLTQSTKPDSAAEQWVSSFRDRLQSSDLYCIVPDKDKAIMVISVVGMDADINKSSTAISLAIYTVRDSIFLDHWMYVADKENLQTSCEKAVTALQKEMRELKRLRMI